MEETPQKEFSTSDFMIACLAANEALRHLIEVMQSTDITAAMIEPHLLESRLYAKRLAGQVCASIANDIIINQVNTTPTNTKS